MNCRIVSIGWLTTLLVCATLVADQPLTKDQETRIATIRAEIRAKIKRLEELETKLIDAVRAEKAADDKPKAPPKPRPMEKAAIPMAGSGLIGHAVVGGRDSHILFHYQHGKIFNPEPLRKRISGDFVLQVKGELDVPRDMVVKAWHAGGGVNGDVNTLFVGGRKISSVGDDRSKQAISDLKLKKGAHEVVWELKGGTFRNNLLKFVDPESGKLVPLGFSKIRLPDVKIKEVVRVGSDRRGWPIPSDW